MERPDSVHLEILVKEKNTKEQKRKWENIQKSTMAVFFLYIILKVNAFVFKSFYYSSSYIWLFIWAEKVQLIPEFLEYHQK